MCPYPSHPKDHTHIYAARLPDWGRVYPTRRSIEATGSHARTRISTPARAPLVSQSRTYIHPAPSRDCVGISRHPGAPPRRHGLMWNYPIPPKDHIHSYAASLQFPFRPCAPGVRHARTDIPKRADAPLLRQTSRCLPGPTQSHSRAGIAQHPGARLWPRCCTCLWSTPPLHSRARSSLHS